jgi:hypothetical protein
VRGESRSDEGAIGERRKEKERVYREMWDEGDMRGAWDELRGDYVP